MKALGSTGRDVCIMVVVACAAFLCGGASGQTLPDGWLDAPFGLYTPELAGESWFDDATTVTMAGSGNGFGGQTPATDGGRFLFRLLRGDCELVADVPFLDRAVLHDDARAGVMIRASGDRQDCFATLVRQPGSSAEPAYVRFQHRGTKGGNSGSQTPVAGVSQGKNYLSDYGMSMIRMRLVRQGGRVAGWMSTNETETAWFKSHDMGLSLGEDVLAGLVVNRAATRGVEIMTNTFSNVSVRELVSVVRDAAGERRVVTWAADLPDAPEGAAYRLSYGTEYAGTFTVLAEDAAQPFETAVGWMVGTPLYFRVEYVTEGATNLLGTSGACALRQPQLARAAPAVDGLWAAYHAPANAAASLAERLETSLDDNWTNAVAGLGESNFGIIFNGAVTPTASGLYVFGSDADDTLRLVLGAQEILADVNQVSNETASVSTPVWLEAGRCYGLRAEYAQAVDGKRLGLQWAMQGDTAFAPIPSDVLTPFPLPWQHADIGTVDVGGYAEYDWTGGAFTVAGAGAGIGGAADGFRYAWQVRQGDFDCSARVLVDAADGAFAVAGLMVRGEGTGSVACAGIYLVEDAADVQVVVRSREVAGGTMRTLATGPSFAKSQAVSFHVSRTGDSFAFLYSTGGDWTELARFALLLPDAVLFGMAVASTDPLVPAAAAFDQWDARAYESVALGAEADTFVQAGNADTNYGTNVTLSVKRYNGDTTREAFLTFDASRFGAARSAKVMLSVVEKNVSLARETVMACLVDDTRWPERGMTWNASPTGTRLPSAHLDPLDPRIAGVGVVPAANEWLEIDVSDAFNRAVAGDGRLSLQLSSQVTQNGTLLNLASREHGTASLRPKLVIVPEAPTRPSVRVGDVLTSAAVTWDAFAGATAYRVWRAAGTPTAFAPVSGDVAGTAFTNTGLTAGEVYHYAVSALTAAGETGLSPAVSVAAAAQAVTLTPTDDAHVRGGADADTVQGVADLNIKNTGWNNAANSREAFMRFDTRGFAGVEKALLSLTVKTHNGSNALRADVWLIPDSDWSEATVTWNNPPAGVVLPIKNGQLVPAEGKVIRVSLPPGSVGTEIMFDVTAMVREAARAGIGKMTLGLSRNDTDSTPNLVFYSKDQTGANLAHIPKLTLYSVRPAKPDVTDAAGGVGLSWPAFQGAQSYTVRRAETPAGPYAVLAVGVTDTAHVAAVTEGWFTVSAVTANGETPASEPVYGRQASAYIPRLPVADTYTESSGNAPVNYGQSVEMRIKSTTMSPARETFLRYDAAGLERATSVRLRLNARATDSAIQPSRIIVYSEDVGEWNENVVTWNTPIPGLARPYSNTSARAPNEVARILYTTYDSGGMSYVEADVTAAARAAAVAGRPLTFCLCGENATAQSPLVWAIASKESANAAQHPVLLVDAGAFGAPVGARALRDEEARAATLAWDAVPGAASYTVQRVLPGGARETVAQGLTDTAWVLEDMWNNDTAYVYEITAIRADGTESAAAVIDATLTRTFQRTAVADTFIRGGAFSNDVYGTDPVLYAKGDSDPEFTRQAYLRFDAQGLPALTRALLRLHVATVGNADMTLVAQAMADNGWTETGDAALTWETAPATGIGDPVPDELWRGNIAGTVAGATLEADVTAGVRAWLARNPGAESLVIRVFSVSTVNSGLKQVQFTSKDGAMFPDRIPALVFTTVGYPVRGSMIILK